MTIIRGDQIGTAALTAAVGAAVIAPSDVTDAIAFAVSVILFVVGVICFAAGFFKAVGRSRTELIGTAQLYFLTGGVAPPPVRNVLLGIWGVQVGMALAAGIARPFTSLATATLAPVFGLGLNGLWASRHGTFPPRETRN